MQRAVGPPKRHARTVLHPLLLQRTICFPPHPPGELGGLPEPPLGLRKLPSPPLPPRYAVVVLQCLDMLLGTSGGQSSKSALLVDTLVVFRTCFALSRVRMDSK